MIVLDYLLFYILCKSACSRRNIGFYVSSKNIKNRKREREKLLHGFLNRLNQPQYLCKHFRRMETRKVLQWVKIDNFAFE